MTRVLVTGGTGYLATNILRILLENDYSVITTVRSESKAKNLQETLSKSGSGKIDICYVSDLAKEDAFDEVLQTSPPIELIIHSASPVIMSYDDAKKDLLDPAINGTIGILKSTQRYAQSVQRVVITSSFAAIRDKSRDHSSGYTYSEKDWNPVTMESFLKTDTSQFGYAASKTIAERAAWDFMKHERPNFSLITINPPMIYGPLNTTMQTLDTLNTTSLSFKDLLTGKWKERIPDTNIVLFTDVRDVALAHVLALKSDLVVNQRVFTVTGHYTNKDIVRIVRQNFPEFEAKLPSLDTPGGEILENNNYKVDNSRYKKLLNKDFITFEQCIIDWVKTFKEIGVLDAE